MSGTIIEGTITVIHVQPDFPFTGPENTIGGRRDAMMPFL
jgi:hypothetical protein